MANAACYVRVSTDNQLENYSIEEQTDRLKAFCKAKDIHIVKFYIDGGYSGGNLNRPQLLKMLEDIDKKIIDTVIVYKLDRLSRSQKDTLLLIEDQFLAKHVDFISINENFDTSTPLGRAMIGILSVFAQLEKDQITERFTMGRVGRAKNGYYHGGGYAPTGYDYVNGELIINEYEALQVQDLYNRYSKGHTIYDCWKYMQKTYGGIKNSWSSETLVRNVLQNEIYLGKVKFNGITYPGNHFPIISQELYDNVQRVFAAGRDGKGRSGKKPFKAGSLLSGLLYCGDCGAKYHAEHGNYSCYSRTKSDQRYIIDPNCKNKKWDIEELDNLVIQTLSNLEFADISMKPENPGRRIDYAGRIGEINKQIVKLVELYQLGNVPVEFISEKAEVLKEEREVLLKKEAEDCAGTKIIETKAADTTISNKEISTNALFTSLFIYGDLAEKRYCLSFLIDKIYINENAVSIVLKHFQ